MTSIERSQNIDSLDREIWDNADYYATGDVAKANAFATALTRAIATRPESAGLGGTGGETIRYNLTVLQKMLEDTRKWLSYHSYAENQVTYDDYRNYRD